MKKLPLYTHLSTTVRIRSKSLYPFIFIFSSFFFLFSTLVSTAQERTEYKLEFSLADSSQSATFQKLEKELRSQKTFRDTFQVMKELKSILMKLHGNAYLAASIDSVYRVEKTYFAKIYLGKLYQWARLDKGNVDELFLTGTGFRKKLYENKILRYQQIQKLQEGILSNCENNGYPFARLRLDSIRMEDSLLSAQLHLEKNKLIRIDSVVLRGEAGIASVYIYNYIGIRPGDVYNESQLAKISNRIKELPFLRESRPARILFTEKETKLELFLENKKANQFDGIIGLLPDEGTPGKYQLTGEARIKLHNALQRGEILELNWKQLPAKTQDLKLKGFYPFLFSTPFGLEGNLAIYRKDSTYTDVTRGLGIHYSFTGNNFIKAFVRDKESSLQSTKALASATVLPPFADISSLSYGVTVHYEKLDYRLNPRKGFIVESTVLTGNRVIKKNSDLNPLLYDSLKLRTVSYQGETEFDFYFSLGGRHVMNLGGQAGYIYNEELFSNELYRIGGLRSLRGFDEESIYASGYGIGKAEYRYILEQNSFLFAFVNAAWYESQLRNNFTSDTPFGFGAGIDFETRLGIMSVSYALGKQFSNPIFFRNGKIHFGIVNYF